jgi:hypothetical protein
MPLSRITSAAIQDESIIPIDILDYSITSNQLSNTGVVATTYGGGTSGTVVVPVINTDIAGRITSAANQTLSLTSFGNIDSTALSVSGKSNVATITVNTSLAVTGTTVLGQAKERVNITGTGAGGTINFYVLGSTGAPTGNAVSFFNSSSSSNFTLNVTGSQGGTTLNSLMNVGESLTVVVLSTQGASSWSMASSIQVDGTATGVTTKWASQIPGTSTGGTNGIDCYSVTIIKTASATYTVLASLTKFV